MHCITKIVFYWVVELQEEYGIVDNDANDDHIVWKVSGRNKIFVICYMH